MTLIYWFRQDCRISDNPALFNAAHIAGQSGQQLLLIVLRSTAQPTPWGFERSGPNRNAYQNQAYAGLAEELNKQDVTLWIPRTDGLQGLWEVCHETGTQEVHCEQLDAPEELAQVQWLRNRGLRVVTTEQSAMLSQVDLPFDAELTPTTFTEFRRQVEQARVQPRQPVGAPSSIHGFNRAISAAQPWHADRAQPHQAQPVPDPRSSLPYQDPSWAATESAAQAHLQQYFKSSLPRHYKDTRNALSGTEFSTKFSGWLAVGAISARQIYQALKDHETAFGANDSTYWIWFELLWRDHFRLMMKRFGSQLFKPHGLLHASKVQRRCLDEGAIDRWRLAQTGESLVDAGMRELHCTGYLSNRMRQIVASYLIHDLSGDWRGGAAWFEHCLLDFDVCSNQGNWAYITGVGTDPRGGRRFNVAKQAHDHDPDYHYRSLWDIAR